MSNDLRGIGFWARAWFPVVIMCCIIAVESTPFLGSDHTDGPLRRIWQALFGHVADAHWELVHHIIRKTGLRQQPVPWYLPKLSSLRQYLTAIFMVAAGILVAFTPLGERLVPDPVLRTFLVLCCWLTPWLISKIARAHGEEDVEATEPGTQPSEQARPPLKRVS